MCLFEALYLPALRATFFQKKASTWRPSAAFIKIVAELCMALTVASRHCVPKAPVRLHKATPALNSQYSILSCKSKKQDATRKAKHRLTSDFLSSMRRPKLTANS